MPDLETMRHSASHVMAEAVQHLFPEARFGVGPAIENGFYYDIELSRPLTPEDLEKIEGEMRKIVADNHPFVTLRHEPRGGSAFLPGTRSTIQGGDYRRPRRGTAFPSTSRATSSTCAAAPTSRAPAEIGAFKLLSVAGAYWRGDEKRPMLQRIYGTAFPYAGGVGRVPLAGRGSEEAGSPPAGDRAGPVQRLREVGPGLILWHPKGGVVRVAIEDFWRQAHFDAGYDIVFTPHIGQVEPVGDKRPPGQLCGEHVLAPMEVEGQSYYVKPMNCPFHIEIYKTQTCAATGICRSAGRSWERCTASSGAACSTGCCESEASPRTMPTSSAGPTRSRMKSIGVLEFTFYMFKSFGFKEFDIYLSTRPGEVRRRPRRLGQGDGGAPNWRWRRRGLSTTWMRAEGRSTARRSTSR